MSNTTTCTSAAIRAAASALGYEPELICRIDEETALWGYGPFRALETSGEPLFEEADASAFAEALEELQ